MKTTVKMATALALVMASTMSAQAGELGNGAYAGVHYAFGSGENDWAGELWVLGDSAAGGYLGYDMNMGSYFLGGEISLTGKGIKEVDDPLYVYEQLLDLKARAGTSVGVATVYGMLGYSTAKYDGNGTPYDASGMLFGLGAAMEVADSVHAGAEYVIRNYSDVSPANFEGDVRTLSIRVGYNF